MVFSFLYVVGSVIGLFTLPLCRLPAFSECFVCLCSFSGGKLRGLLSRTLIEFRARSRLTTEDFFTGQFPHSSLTNASSYIDHLYSKPVRFSGLHWPQMIYFGSAPC